MAITSTIQGAFPYMGKSIRKRMSMFSSMELFKLEIGSNQLPSRCLYAVNAGISR